MADETRTGAWMSGGFLLGAVVGAAAALLFAPQPGIETRENVKNAWQKLRRKANVGEAIEVS